MSHVADLDILAEEEADRQRVVDEQHLAEILAVAKEKRAEAERAAEEEERATREYQREEARTQLASLLSTSLGIVIPRGRIGFMVEGDLWERPVVEFGGRTFSYQVIHRLDRIVVAVACPKCYLPLWIRADSPAALLQALSEPVAHGVCPPSEHEDALNQPSDQEPPRTVEEILDAAAARCAAAFNRISELEDERAIIKPKAIARLLELKLPGITSVTAAEKIVEQDEAYALHREQQRAAEREKWSALAAWNAAKIRVGVPSEVAA